MPTVSELVQLPKEEVIAFLGKIYEKSGWVAEQLLVYNADTFKDITKISTLASEMKRVVDLSSNERKKRLLCEHPDLCEKVEKLKELTEESQEEQGLAGLHTMEGEELEKFTTLNKKYKERFDFPFILAVRNATKFTVLSALEGRLANNVPDEFVIAIAQVHKIAWMRLLAALDTSDAEGFLTCHVLDTANGCPARKMRIHLHRLSPPEEAGLVAEYITNDDGRLEGGPALSNKEGEKKMTVGTYEFTFFVADYFASKGNFFSGVPFLDQVPIRFGIDNPDEHYHVPLLVSPWSFSTYRGS